MRKETTSVEQDNYSAQELFVEAQTSCCLCGHDLEFDHEMDFQNQKIVEQAHCPGCHIKTKSSEHRLH